MPAPLPLEQTEKIFTALYARVDGYQLSATAELRTKARDQALTYGEVSLPGFAELMADLGPAARGIFYDLGSGTGKAVLLASLLGNFSAVIGIEIVPELVAAAQAVRERFYNHFGLRLPRHLRHAPLYFVNRDLFDYDWSDGDVVFCQTTCFTAPLLAALENQLGRLRPGSTILTTTQPLFGPGFEKLSAKEYRLGWGEATIYRYQKL